MEPIYIHFNDQKKTMFKFSKKDEINNILFTSDKDYFITSMKYFTKLDDDLIVRKESKKNPKTIQNIWNNTRKR